jgi:hypothetical protein
MRNISIFRPGFRATRPIARTANLASATPAALSPKASTRAQAMAKYKELTALLDSPDGKLVQNYLEANPTPGFLARFRLPKRIVDLSPASDERFRYILALSDRGPQLLNRDSGDPAFSAGTPILWGKWFSGEGRAHTALASIDISSARHALARHAAFIRHPGNYSALERSHFFRTSFMVSM